MKKLYIIFILIALWIGTSIITFKSISKHIESKDISLKKEIRKNIKTIFENQSDGNVIVTSDCGYFDSPVHGAKVQNFKRAQIPPRPKMDNYKNVGGISPEAFEYELTDWNEKYGDVATLWNLNWGANDVNHKDDEGWNIVAIQCYGTDDSIIHTFVKFPYQVALKRTEWGNYYTVPQAVAEAFNFYANNPDSGISDRFEKGAMHKIWNKIYDCQNEYYGIYRNDDVHDWHGGTSIPGEPPAKEGGAVENGWMHNGYYRVFIARTQETHYGIKKHPWNPDIIERDKLTLWSLVAISVIFLIPITIIFILIIKERKLKRECTK